MIYRFALCACTVAAAWAAPAQAAEVGLGVAVFENSGTLFVPIDIDPALRLEPYFTNSHQRSSDSTNQLTRNQRTILGVGVTGLWPVADNIRFLAGGRVGHFRARYHYESASGGPGDNSAAGLVLTPLAGFEYLLNKRLAVGIETSYYYARLKGHGDGYYGRVDTKQTEAGTSTAVTLRFFFP